MLLSFDIGLKVRTKRAWDQDLPLFHELAFWSPFLMDGSLVQPGYMGEDLGPVSE